jgi:hypothetical protein
MGLGDLLAEALAAYQESRDVHADVRSTGTPRADGPIAAEDTNRDLPRYGAGSTRRAAGLALASNPEEPSPAERDEPDPGQPDPNPRRADEKNVAAAEVSEAVTNPLLRLPDLTAEPRWAPPEPGHRSAAGD